MRAEADGAQGVLAVAQAAFAHLLAHALADVLADVGLHVAVLHVHEAARHVDGAREHFHGRHS